MINSPQDETKIAYAHNSIANEPIKKNYNQFPHPEKKYGLRNIYGIRILSTLYLRCQYSIRWILFLNIIISTLLLGIFWALNFSFEQFVFYYYKIGVHEPGGDGPKWDPIGVGFFGGFLGIVMGALLSITSNGGFFIAAWIIRRIYVSRKKTAIFYQHFFWISPFVIIFVIGSYFLFLWKIYDYLGVFDFVPPTNTPRTPYFLEILNGLEIFDKFAILYCPIILIFITLSIIRYFVLVKNKE